MGLLSFALRGSYKRYWNNLKDLSKTVNKKPITIL